MTKKKCLHVGIDIEQWLKEDLLDVLTTGGGYIPFTMPTRELVELGHAHEVSVYPTISASGFKGPLNTQEHWRAVAANAWHAGADGMYLFNTFPTTPKHPRFTELGDPEALERMDKVFAMDIRPILEGDLRQGIVQSQILPITLDSGEHSHEAVIQVGDDIAGAAKAGTLAGAVLRIRFEGKTSENTIVVQLNGRAIEERKEIESGWAGYAVNPADWRRGDNTLSFRLRSTGGKGKVSVKAVESKATYK